jgi:glc operon protein GlcG
MMSQGESHDDARVDDVFADGGIPRHGAGPRPAAGACARTKSARCRPGEDAVQHAVRPADFAKKKAGEAVQAALAQANQHGWALNVAVVDSGGNLVTFARMDGAQLASIAIAEHKARAAAKFRRPTRVFEEAMQKGLAFIATLDDVVASRGGIPLIEDGKLIGAIGCSGATGSQDEVVCMAGAATINK